MPLPDIKCNPDTADIFSLPTLVVNEATISRTLDIIQELVKRLELTDKVVRDKLILIKRDLMTIRNCRHAIFRRQDELSPLNKYSWLEPMAGLFHLEMNFLSMLFGKFWGVAGDMVSLNRYHDILKQKYVSKTADNNNFHHFDDFFRTVIEAMVVTLCIHTTGCSTIDELQIWIGRSDWPTLIANVEKNYLDIFKVQSIRHTVHCKTTAIVDTMIDVQKKE